LRIEACAWSSFDCHSSTFCCGPTCRVANALARSSEAAAQRACAS
jgi:hypothetical protein